MKSPSHYDGKPIGTPTDAKSPFHAGVTMGPDQIERAEALRKLRNRAVKAAVKSADDAFWRGLTPKEAERVTFQAKRRRARARQWRDMVRKGRTIAEIAEQAKRTPDEIYAEIKWLDGGTAKR